MWQAEMTKGIEWRKVTRREENDVWRRSWWTN
jgi:hypothetical protein